MNVDTVNVKGFLECVELENITLFAQRPINNDFARFKNLQILNVVCSDLTSDMIRSCTNIEELDVTNCKNIIDINYLTKLRKLDARLSCSLSNDCIKKCSNIEYLNISENVLINDINLLTNLKTLIANHNNCLENGGILDCYNIERMEIWSNNKIIDINHLINLKELIVGGNSDLDEKGFIMCTNIELLDITCNSRIKDLNHLINLKVLHMNSGKCCVNLKSIEKCAKLELIYSKYNYNFDLNNKYKFKIIS